MSSDYSCVVGGLHDTHDTRATYPRQPQKGGLMLPGECVNDTVTTCLECKTTLTTRVLTSAAGYYLGFRCPSCGPYSRESGYFPSRESAERALESGSYGR